MVRAAGREKEGAISPDAMQVLDPDLILENRALGGGSAERILSKNQGMVYLAPVTHAAAAF